MQGRVCSPPHQVLEVAASSSGGSELHLHPPSTCPEGSKNAWHLLSLLFVFWKVFLGPALNVPARLVAHGCVVSSALFGQRVVLKSIVSIHERGNNLTCTFSSPFLREISSFSLNPFRQPYPQITVRFFQEQCHHSRGVFLKKTTPYSVG